MDSPDQNGFSIGPPATPSATPASVQQPQGGAAPASTGNNTSAHPDANGFSIGPPAGGSVSSPYASSQGTGQPVHNDELKITSPASSLTGIAQRGAAALEGIGEGVFKTAAGAGDAFDKMTGMDKGAVSKELHNLAGDNNTTGSSSAYNKVGYGGETLAEFMLGDEALKGMSMADRLGVVGKWMKIAEKSPRLIRAMQTGADIAKVQGELTPDEISLIQKYPRIAKMVNVGVQAARTGAVQGAQTLVRSGGDVKEAAKDAAGAALAGAAIGTVAHGASGIIRKGGDAAQTIARMNDVAAGAPTSNAVKGDLADAVRGAFDKETGTLQNNLDDATSTVGMFGEGAPQQSQITSAAQKAAKVGKQAVHDQYQNGLDKLVDMAGDHSIPYEGSPLHKAALELQAATPETAGPLDQAFNVAQPGSPKANALIDRLSDPHLGAAADLEEPEPSGILDASGNPVKSEPETPEAAELDMKHLVARRQSLSNLVRNLGPNDGADRAIYGKLLDGIDDTIAKLADGVPEADGAGEEGAGEDDESGEEPQPSAARKHFDAMNAAYRNGIRPFQNRDVKNILSGKLNDVAKSIMGGQTSLADINDVKQAIGKNNFQAVSRASLQNIVKSFTNDDGELDYKGLFSKIGKMNPEVRQAMFGDQGNALSDALKVANDSSNGLSEIGKQVNDLLGNGDVDSLVKDPDRVKQIANLVGPDGMKALGKSVMENQIRKASTVMDKSTGTIKAAQFDPDKVLDWWMGMKDSPEVRDSLFSVDKDSAQHYNDMMKELAQASSVKKLVKYGVLPVTMGTAGVVHGPGAALFGALAGLGTEAGFGRARDILDSVANNPRTWKALSFGGKVADKASAVKNAIPQVARDAGIAAAYKGVKNALSGSDQN